jgi:hypothetical protein
MSTLSAQVSALSAHECSNKRSYERERSHQLMGSVPRSILSCSEDSMVLALPEGCRSDRVVDGSGDMFYILFQI